MLDALTAAAQFIIAWLAFGMLWCIVRAIVDLDDDCEVDNAEVLGAALLGPICFGLLLWHFVSVRIWPWLRTNARLAWRSIVRRKPAPPVEPLPGIDRTPQAWWRNSAGQR